MHPCAHIQKALVRRVLRSEITPVQLKYAPAHHATDYTHWYESDTMYPVNYELYYEPYMVCDRTHIPLYDERFSGYGNDKVTCVYINVRVCVYTYMYVA